MPTRTELEPTTGARRVVAALVLAVALPGLWSTASAGKPRGAESTPQADAGGFQLDAPALLGLDRPLSVDRLSEGIHHAAAHVRAHRNS